ncbi:MAG: HD domain-containing protein [Lachnospiraceae bacterium]|nr:HD domain-containing protein [Lachnospiraceae bacterium]
MKIINRKYYKHTLACMLMLVMTGIYTFPVFADSNIERRDRFASNFLARYVTTVMNTGFNNFPSDESNTVLQTRDGFVWFGGYNGLYRYDGARYTIWDAGTPDGFGSSNIRTLYEDADGVLWIGTNDRGLVAYQNGIFTVYDRSHGLPSNTIRAIASGADGSIYCGTPEGIIRVNREREITAVVLDTELQQAVTGLCFDAGNNMYAILNSGELFVYTNDNQTIRHPHDGSFISVAQISGNLIAAGTREDGVFILQYTDNSFTFSQTVKTPLTNIGTVYEDSNGFIWLLAENGIGFLDKNRTYRNVGNPSGAGFYSGIFEDYQNSYWITGTRGGVVKLTLSAFTNFNALHNIETGTVNAIILDDDNTYIGTNNGLLVLDKNGNSTRMNFTEQINTRVRGLFRDSSGNIWICTYSELGVIRYTPTTNTYKSWNAEDGLISDRTRLILELPNGIIVVGTATGVSFIRGDDVISVNEALNTDTLIDLPDIMVLSMVYSADGTLYIGTDGGGVYAVSRDGTTRYREDDDLTGGVVLRMLADPGGNGVWVAASPGLCYIGGDGTVRIIDKLPPYTFLDILPYNDDLLLLTSSKIIRTNAEALHNPDLPLEYTSIDRSAGLTGMINANAWNVLTDDGNLYFCTDIGVNIYNFENNIVPFIPHAAITNIYIDDIKHNVYTDSIFIPRDANRLTIHLSFLSFGLLDNTALHYILAGQDNEPHTLNKGDNMEISYTNLRGGHYTLQVWTEDSAGNRGNFIELDLQKDLQLFERVYVWVTAIILAILLFTLAAALIMRIRTRRLIEKQREYRTIILQALTAISSAIDAKDSYTSGHSVRVAAYSVEIAKRMGMSKEFTENLYYIGLLHDVGKIGIPDTIINKPDKLTDAEFDIMKQHSGIGKEILKEITAIHNMTAGAEEHHERWDGKGYQQGIAGKDITLEARIIAAADSYDAMSSDRSYRKALPKEVILEEFKNCRGSQFDPEIADIMIRLIERDHFAIIISDTIGIFDTNVNAH